MSIFDMSTAWSAREPSDPAEDFRRCVAALEREDARRRAQRWRCPHEEVVLPPDYARALDGMKCPFGCGVTLRPPV